MTNWLWFGVAAALAFVVAGCGSLDPVIYVDMKFSSEEQAQIQEAADMWEVASGGTVHFDLVFDQSVWPKTDEKRVLIRATNDEAIWYSEANVGLETLRPVDIAGDCKCNRTDSQTLIVVPERFASMGATLRQVVAHELGHAAGLHHVDAIEALMFPWAPRGDQMVQDQCLDWHDLLQVRALVGLGKTFRPCAVAAQ